MTENLNPIVQLRQAVVTAAVDLAESDGWSPGTYVASAQLAVMVAATTGDLDLTVRLLDLAALVTTEVAEALLRCVDPDAVAAADDDRLPPFGFELSPATRDELISVAARHVAVVP